MKAQFFAQFEQRRQGNRQEARLIKATQTMPREIDGVLVKVVLEIPDAAFAPLQAEGVIEAGFVGIPIRVEPDSVGCADCGQTLQAGVEHVCYEEEE